MKKNNLIVTYLTAIFCLFLFQSSRLHAADETYSEQNTLKKMLDNGMTVVIHRMTKTPITSIDITVRAGSATEGVYSGGGISHLMEHMVFKGGIEKKGESYSEKLKLLGGHMNAFTSHDFTVYYVTVPSEHTVEALTILRDLISNPYFDALELKKEKEVILDEIKKNKDEPSRVASDYAWQSVFREHPYKYPVIGYEDLFEKIGKQELEDYYASRYSPHRMILVIGGDVNKEGLFGEVEGIFGPLRRNFVADIPSISEPPQSNPRTRTEYRDIRTAHVSLSYRSVSIDDAALYPLDVLSVALGDGEDSILTRELRNKRQLVYHISCRNPTLRDSGLFYIYFTADPDKADEAIAAVLEEIEKIRKNGISGENLKKVRNIVKADLVNTLETVEGRTRDISISEAVSGDYHFSEKYVEKLSKVTDEDVRSAAERYLKKERLNIVHVLPKQKDGAGPGPEPVTAGIRSIEKHDMANGMRILVAEDHSTANCSISALFLGGVRAETAAANGVSHLTSQLLLDGTEDMSEEDIKRAIEFQGGGIYGFSANNSLGVRINLLSEDWRKGIEVLSEVIIHPAFSEDKIEKEKRLTLAAIKERDDDIISSGLMLFKKNFYKDHPYSLHPLGTPDSIDGLKRSDILEFYNKICVPGNMVVTVSGDIDPAAVTDEVKRVFGDFKRDAPVMPQIAAALKPNGKEQASFEMTREQSMIILGFPSVKLADNDRYVFEVMQAITSGYNGRMFNNIREKLGMGYIVGTSFQPGLEEGCFIFYALSARENLEKIKEAILKEAKDLKENPVSENEFLAAKRYLLAQAMSDLQTNSSFGFATALDELYGLGYKNYETYDEKINAVTPGQIQRAANQYFDLDNYVIVKVYGEGDGAE